MADILAKAQARHDAETASRKHLPCFPHDRGFVDGGDDERARGACEAAEAWRSCPHAEPPKSIPTSANCPRVRAMFAAAKAEANEKAAVARRLTDAGVPEGECAVLLAAADGTALRPTEPLRFVRAWLATPSRLLHLAGPTGIGKTLAACYALAKRGGVYATAYQVWRPGGESRQSFDVDAAIRAPVLVVDQLGRENVGQSGYGLSVFEEIIDSRYAAARSTILCGNLTRPEFDTRYGDVIADRFRGGGRWIQCDGASLRGVA